MQVSRTVQRDELSTGEVLTIQRIRRKYTCYVVQVAILDAPVVLVDSGTKDQCLEAYADRLRDDVLECEV